MSERCAVILAGGKGTRLRPYTITMPKPLVPVGDYPILEIIIRQLSKKGFKRVIITVNHQADLIKTYFGTGDKWGVNIEYSLENKPLGTMGPLKNITNLPDNFIVMNGDILTDLDYGVLLDNHIKRKSIYTISAFRREHNVDYGVLNLDDNNLLTGFEEKPKLQYTVSMGIYAVSRDVLKYIPKDEYFGFDTLMLKLIESNEKVRVDVFTGYWLDIGRPEDYQKATDDFDEKKGYFI
ncbi:Nucleoside-diphosphate-sugar pyrophosphorylase involved in lipopolysaccharide biosynthesis/translation initiation factor 2B, gamma/epsilon subunits (eIF-2Bgamma/eIF-2Bepsilon) [Desulfitobacterium sp. LBE]|uniref:sugar phosphate nucleotidyltransferase n=1 Tax=Desulfitobacterium sp. LBE TaxID=884086 RepID=UPI001198ECE3|nr:sugar phosphate nucleotidyltransferase [Desulfitobacterium sp. LBE]TWH59726.1 Nucleoside-diphosphate-sugar pyrophosphorylase involved in lipopolysaccharide biosynthesis/translation initiation factor 2B, gamma/epsilon subunits (eIF-2Bgamma/eIF-2Bepsilon) [Desulfitobacterium sp. LBE]